MTPEDLMTPEERDAHLDEVLVHGRTPVTPVIVPYDDGWPDMNHYAEAKGPTIRRLLACAREQVRES